MLYLFLGGEVRPRRRVSVRAQLGMCRFFWRRAHMKKMSKPGSSPQTPLIKLHLLQLHTGGTILSMHVYMINL